MSATEQISRVARKRGDWMRPVDDPILEHMRDEGNLTPQAVSNLGVCTRSHASMRLSALSRAGFVEKVANTQGLYRLTDDGRAYLDEELDAAELDPVE